MKTFNSKKLHTTKPLGNSLSIIKVKYSKQIILESVNHYNFQLSLVIIFYYKFPFEY